jgi:site-specific recombinase XerC
LPTKKAFTDEYLRFSVATKRPIGHSKIETTMIYAHLSKEHLKNSIDALNYKC